MKNRTNKRRGLSLFELAAVVAIAAVLFVLAIGSTRSFVTRTKVSKAREEQRVLARAVENYILDHADAPPGMAGLVALTRPNPYIVTLPHDPFQNRNQTYVYLVPGLPDIAGVVVSPGPDKDLDLPPELWKYVCTSHLDRRLFPTEEFREARGSAAVVRGTAAPAVPSMTEADRAVLGAYLRLGQYSEEAGVDGDIILVIRR